MQLHNYQFENCFTVWSDEIRGILSPLYYISTPKNTHGLVPLKEVALINPSRKRQKVDDAQKVPYVGLPETDDKRVRTVLHRPFREVGGRNIIKKGDILFARIEPSIFNKKYIYVDDLDGAEYAYTSTEFYIVEAKDGLKLIDWESLKCSDPAKDIANILIDLELKNNDLDLFLREYQKIRRDPTILERAKTYAVLLRAVYFLWEITRSFEIINKELAKEYLNKTTAQSHINEAKFQFKKLSKLIDVPKINIDSLFTGAKN